MVRVNLTKDVGEGGVDLAAAIQDAKARGMRPNTRGYPKLKVVTRKGKATRYTAGTEVTMHEDSANKWIARGLCELVA